MSFDRIITTALLAVVSLLLQGTVAFAQEEEEYKVPIKLIHAEQLLFEEDVNSQVQRLIGNVRFEHKGALLFCDSAWLYESSNNLDAYGRVHIKQGDTLDLYADTLYYDGNSQMAKLRGNIRMRDESISLTTNYLDYNLSTDIGQYYENGRIILKENQNVLTSKNGYYYADTKELFFKDSVVLRHPRYTMTTDTMVYDTKTEVTYFHGPTLIVSDSNTIYCENGWYDTKNERSQFEENAYIVTKEQKLFGDSLFYDRNSGYGEVFGNISMIDTVQSVVLNGDYAIYRESEEESLITGRAVMTQIYNSDSLFLHADTLQSLPDSAGKRQILAYHKVKFFRTDLQGKCDSLVYSEADSTFKLFDAPVLWSEENQLTGLYVEIKSFEGKIDKLTLYDEAFIISEQDTTSYNQIKGKKMTGYFTDNGLRKILVEGNGQTMYYAVEEEKLDTLGNVSENKIGLNEAICSDILIFIDTANNNIQKISFLNTPTATLYPMNQLPQKNLLLEGFKWRIEHRPLKREDIFVWKEEAATVEKEEENLPEGVTPLNEQY